MAVQPIEQTEASLAEALRTVTVNSAYNASRALSKWFKRGVRLTADGIVAVPLHELSSVAGAPDEPIVAVRLPLKGDIEGDILLTFPETVAFSLVDLMINAKDGTTTTLSELEASCLQETGNIVASAFTNCLSSWLKLNIIPDAPIVVHDLACAIIEPLLVGQAGDGDQALIAKTEFELDNHRMDWRLMLLPSADSLEKMRAQCQSDSVHTNALHTIAINGAFDASRAMSKWLKRGIRLSTNGFQKIPLRDVGNRGTPDEPVVALRMDLGDQLHGHALLVLPQAAAFELVDILMNREPGTTTSLDEMSKSCLEETGNIVSGSFVNSWCKWLDIHSKPGAPLLLSDMREAIFQDILVEQAQVSDEVFLTETCFSVNGRNLDWEFYLLPAPSSLRMIQMSWS